MDGRLGGHNKTKCIDWVDIRVDTFYMVLTTYPPLIMTKKSGLTPIFGVYPPRLFHIVGGIIPYQKWVGFQENRVFTAVSENFGAIFA